MRQKEDDKGLRYDIDLVGTRLDDDLLKHIEAGNIRGSSFAFMIPKGGERWETENGQEYRTLVDVDLYDVGPVTNPAYDATTTAARSSYDRWSDERRRMEIETSAKLREMSFPRLHYGT